MGRTRYITKISWRCPLCTRPTRLLIFFIVLAHWNNSRCVNMLRHSEHIICIPIQSVFTLTPYWQVLIYFIVSNILLEIAIVSWSVTLGYPCGIKQFSPLPLQHMPTLFFIWGNMEYFEGTGTVPSKISVGDTIILVHGKWDICYCLNHIAESEQNCMALYIIVF